MRNPRVPDIKQAPIQNRGARQFPKPGNPLLDRVLEARRSLSPKSPKQDAQRVERIARQSRVIIVEGIPGSGKDTFQKYLREKLEDQDVYDYSEGELLHSWRHTPIKGILKLRIEFLKLFINHVRDVVNKDPRATFLLNRFHLSTYVTTVLRQPDLEREYNEIISELRSLPVHVFMLHLDENEMARRSAHSERSGPWQKYQQQRVIADSFSDTSKRYLWQQT